MTDKELQRLRRPELLSLLLNEEQENEFLREELADVKEKLNSKNILLFS